MKITDYINDENLQTLKNDIGEKRCSHSLNVMEECKKLANNYGIEEEKAIIAGLYHDCGKFIQRSNAYEFIEQYNLVIKEEFLKNYQLLHPALGYYVGKIKYNIKDEEIINAIYYHTTLRPDPTLLDKIVYIADAIEPSRDYEGVEDLRKLAYIDLDSAVLLSLENTIIDIIKKKKYLGLDSIISRNHLLEKISRWIDVILTYW